MNLQLMSCISVLRFPNRLRSLGGPYDRAVQGTWSPQARHEMCDGRTIAARASRRRRVLLLEAANRDRSASYSAEASARMDSTRTSALYSPQRARMIADPSPRPVTTPSPSTKRIFGLLDSYSNREARPGRMSCASTRSRVVDPTKIRLLLPRLIVNGPHPPRFTKSFSGVWLGVSTEGRTSIWT